MPIFTSGPKILKVLSKYYNTTPIDIIIRANKIEIILKNDIIILRK